MKSAKSLSLFDVKIYLKKKSSAISIGAIMENPEILKFIPDHLKTKKMCKHAVKKIRFVIRYVLDQEKTHQIGY